MIGTSDNRGLDDDKRNCLLNILAIDEPISIGPKTDARTAYRHLSFESAPAIRTDGGWRDHPASWEEEQA